MSPQPGKLKWKNLKVRLLKWLSPSLELYSVEMLHNDHKKKKSASFLKNTVVSKQKNGSTFLLNVVQEKSKTITHKRRSIMHYIFIHLAFDGVVCKDI